MKVCISDEKNAKIIRIYGGTCANMNFGKTNQKETLNKS